MSAAKIQRAVALFDPVWDLLLIPERFRILHLLLESVGYDGSTGELELAFYPLGITGLAAEVCQPFKTFPAQAETSAVCHSQAKRHVLFL